MAHEQLHEPEERLPAATQDMDRAIVSLMEELEAIDWYQQRIAASTDGELAAILAHNRNEEEEHAAMLLEWIRRHDRNFDEKLRAILFREGPIHMESESEPAAARPTKSLGSLGRRR